MSAKVFISYSSIDSKQAKKIAKVLDEINVDYFLDSKDVAWGDDITGQVSNGLAECSALIVVVSPASLKSKWVPFEIGQAKALGKVILPFLTHPSLDMPIYLQNCHHKTRLTDVKAYLKSAFTAPKIIEPKGKQTPKVSNRETLARQKLSETMAMVFVDLMRLLYIASNKAISRPNAARYPEFIGVAEQHFGDFKSHIARFSSALDTASEEQSIFLERRLSWMLTQLKHIRAMGESHAEYFGTMREIGEVLHNFCLVALEDAYKQIFGRVEETLGEALKQIDSTADEISIHKLFRLRLQTQSKLLRDFDVPDKMKISSIADDMDQRFAIMYFAIDYKLLCHLAA